MKGVMENNDYYISLVKTPEIKPYLEDYQNLLLFSYCATYWPYGVRVCYNLMEKRCNMIGVMLSGDIITGTVSYIPFEITLLSMVPFQMHCLFILYKIFQLFVYLLNNVCIL